MPAARYVCFANEGFISYRIDVRKANGNISSSSTARTYRVNEVDISTERKNKSKNRRIFSFYSCSFCRYKGLGLAHSAFDQSNAMLALSSSCKFSAKDTTLFLAVFILYILLQIELLQNLFCLKKQIDNIFVRQ